MHACDLQVARALHTHASHKHAVEAQRFGSGHIAEGVVKEDAGVGVAALRWRPIEMQNL